MGRDELLLEALLDGQPAEAGLEQDEDAGGDRAADDPAVRSKPP